MVNNIETVVDVSVYTILEDWFTLPWIVVAKAGESRESCTAFRYRYNNMILFPSSHFLFIRGIGLNQSPSYVGGQLLCCRAVAIVELFWRSLFLYEAAVGPSYPRVQQNKKNHAVRPDVSLCCRSAISVFIVFFQGWTFTCSQLIWNVYCAFVVVRLASLTNVASRGTSRFRGVVLE